MDGLKKNKNLCINSNDFYKHLASLTSKHSYLIAYSGGLDSHTLLHLLAQAKAKHPQINLRSLYIDHGLQNVSSGWATHCQQIANSLGISHQTIRLNLSIPKGESLEAVAREARYQAFHSELQDNEVLLTAQHQDDQAETLLIQLLRGSGLDGLAAMPEVCHFARGLHIRPLLNTTRKTLENYASQHKLQHITDPSNTDTRFDRNYLRHHITPALKQRWPEMAKTLSRSARFQAEAGELLSHYLSEDLKNYRGKHSNTLSLHALKQVDKIKQKALLRQWIKSSQFPAPSEIKLEHIISDVIYSSPEATPLIHWHNTEIRRYKDDIYIMPPISQPDSNTCIHWDISAPLTLKNNLGTLHPDDLGNLKGILLLKNIPVTVRFRQGGERLRPQKRKHHISLKHLMQEAGIPPWQRQRIPLIYANKQLIQITGLAQINSDTLITTHQ